MNPPPSPSPRVVLVGGGARLAPLAGLLEALARDRGGGAAVERLGDLAELLAPPAPPAPAGVVLLDEGAVDLEDLGILRRFLGRNPAWGVILTGEDDGGRVARRLLPLGGVRWWPWPLDLDQLEALLAPAPPSPGAPEREGTGGVEGVEGVEGAEGAEGAEGEDDLASIEAILEGGAILEDRDPIEDRGEEGRGPEPLPELPPDTDPGPADLRPPPWFRDQVADLADLAQGLDLALHALRSGEGGGGGAGDGSGGDPLQRLEGDVLRLVQFARTLGYLAAPPSPGDQDLDLATLVEELLGGLAGSEPDGPRFLFRAAGELGVRSDKGLLVAALDALLQVAAACSGERDVVRVSVGPAGGTGEGPGEGTAEVRITFPAGPLAGAEPAAILSPYGLRRALPQIGPNALAAASRILQGQGGELALGEDERPGRLAFRVRLPARARKRQGKAARR